MQKPFSILLLSACATLAACTTTTIEVPGVYVMDIQQGNIVTQDMVDQLRPNMSKRQVLYIMGSPMLIDPFHQQRWDYIYAEKPGGEVRQQKRIALLFQGDELMGVQGDFRPSSVPVIPVSKDVTVDVPKRETRDTWWDRFIALFKGSENETENAAKTESPEKTDNTENQNKSTETGESNKSGDGNSAGSAPQPTGNDGLSKSDAGNPPEQK